MSFIHIASFEGNVGDIINHEGFYSSIGLSTEYIEQIEIREFYNNSKELEFDNSLLKKINNSDGLILGGGGFFDVRWEYSNTGTTIDMSEKFINSIKVPVVVNAMGVHIDYSNRIAISRFVRFWGIIVNKQNWLITLRNDGSLRRLMTVYKGDISRINTVPDNGFVFHNRLDYDGKSNIIGLSITNDLFTDDYNGLLDIHLFNKRIASVCRYIIEKGNKICFFLHAPQDIEVLGELYLLLGNKLFRNQIVVSRFDMFSLENAVQIDELYNRCKYVLAMRFHGNVIAIKNCVPVIGLAGHEQIEGLYHELGLNEQCVVVREGFEDKLKKLIDIYENDKNYYIENEKRVLSIIAKCHSEYITQVKHFLQL